MDNSLLDFQEKFLEEFIKMGGLEIVPRDFSNQICNFIENDLNESCRQWEIKGTLAYDPLAEHPATRTIVCIERVDPRTGKDALRIQLILGGHVAWTIYAEK